MSAVTVAPSAEVEALTEAARCVREAREAVDRARTYRARGWADVTASALLTASAYRRAAVACRKTAALYRTFVR
jgi:hypothetical protein